MNVLYCILSASSDVQAQFVVKNKTCEGRTGLFGIDSMIILPFCTCVSVCGSQELKQSSSHMVLMRLVCETSTQRYLSVKFCEKELTCSSNSIIMSFKVSTAPLISILYQLEVLA